MVDEARNKPGSDVRSVDSATAPETKSFPEILPKLDELPKELLVQMVKMHAGPLPMVEDFAAYGEILPSAPDRILSMAERQQLHDHWMDKGTLISETLYRLIGTIAAFCVMLGFWILTGYLAYIGAMWPASIVGAFSTLSTIVSAFIKGRDLRKTTQPEPEKAKPPAPQKPKPRKKN